MDDFLYPEASQILEEVAERHLGVLSFAAEAVALSHMAWHRQRDFASRIIPGVPAIRRARTDINDDAWRFFRSISEPLVSSGLIREFTNIHGGDVVILPDGLHSRLKKGSASGATSNYPTVRIQSISAISEKFTLFSQATPLDVAIQDGVMVDVVFVAAEAMGEYHHVGLRFAAAEESPFVLIEAADEKFLRSISPAAFELVADARMKLAS